MTRMLSFLAALLLTALTWASPPPSSAAESAIPEKVASIRSAATTVHHRTIRIDGLNLFYRESGPPDAPLIVLLHGFPSSSHMFRNLLPALSHRYHVIAPDYPGFGESDAPDRTQFRYSFEHYAELVDSLLTRLEAKRYALYVMDYGAPVGYRLALRHPERVSALVVQNGNAYAEGLLEFWDPIKAYWTTGAQAQRDVLRQGTTFEATRSQYLDGVRDPTRIDPAAWVYDQARLDRPGNVEIQLDLFYDYRTNVELYPRFQAFFRERQPPTLIVWGTNDRIFPAPGARAYLRDLPNAELHLLDTGHFALEDKGSEVALLMLDFFDRTLVRR
jgi:pimeloyl-ACP methyl ester carboxylesterase